MAYRYKSGEGVLRDIWPKGDGISPFFAAEAVGLQGLVPAGGSKGSENLGHMWHGAFRRCRCRWSWLSKALP